MNHHYHSILIIERIQDFSEVEYKDLQDKAHVNL